MAVVARYCHTLYLTACTTSQPGTAKCICGPLWNTVLKDQLRIWPRKIRLQQYHLSDIVNSYQLSWPYTRGIHNFLQGSTCWPRDKYSPTESYINQKLGDEVAFLFIWMFSYLLISMDVWLLVLVHSYVCVRCFSLSKAYHSLTVINSFCLSGKFFSDTVGFEWQEGHLACIKLCHEITSLNHGRCIAG